VSTTIDKIRVLEVEKSRVLNRFFELRSLLTPKISILEKAKEDIEELRKSNFGLAPTALHHAHIISYALGGLIQTSQSLKKS
jgi:hypothetical protein